jgi:prevent-host-death family protein
MRMGLRDANQQFSKAVKAVRAGEEVILTDRGKPIAVIKPLPQSSRGEAAVRHLEVAGLLRPALKTTPLPHWTPRPIKGGPLSRTVREERDAT